MASTTENMSLRNATFTLSVNVMLFILKVFLLLEVDMQPLLFWSRYSHMFA